MVQSHQTLADQVRFQRCISPIDLATAAVNGLTVDMQQYAGVLFILDAGLLTGTVDMKAQQGDQSDGSDAADFSPTKVITQLAATDDNKLAILDVKRADITKRYVRVVVTPTGGTTNLGGVTGMAYRRDGAIPIVQHADTLEVKKA